MEQTAIHKNCVTAAVLLLYEFILSISIFDFFPSFLNSDFKNAYNKQEIHNPQYSWCCELC